MPVNGITCTETINGNNVEIAGQIPDAKTKNQVALVVSTDVNNVNDNNIVYIDQKTSTTSGKFNFNFTLPQNPADVNYGYIIGTDADVDSYIGTISEGQTDDEEPTSPARTVTCTETVDGNNVKISGQISDANTKNQVSLVVSTDVSNVNENNIVHIDQTTSTTSGTFTFNFTLPQNSGVSSYDYIIGTDADTETYIGVINIQQGGNEDDDDDDDDNDHGGDTDITGTTVTVKYYLGADGVFAQTDIDGTSYLLKNGHGDTVTIVRNGNVVDDAEYDAYGNVENPQNITAYTYANYYYDSHSGMYYLRNRFYDSSIARFISEDPIQDGINWYAYANNNPLMYVDPTGTVPVETIIDVASIGWSFYDFVSNPSWSNFGYLAWDVVAALVPYAPGSYATKTLKAGTKILSKSDNYVKSGVWSMKAFDRGYEIEKALGGWCNNFPVIDWAQKTIRANKTYLESIKSIKSIDITASSYQKASTLKSKLKGYVDSLAEFTGVKKWNGTEFKVSSGTSRTLEIAIPPVEMTSSQAKVFKEIVEYANEKGVKVITRIVE